jgi:hypothetical protein
MDPSTNPVTTPPTAAMQFAGIPLDDLRSLALFIACLAAALGLVYLFCQKKFGEPSSSGSDDLVDQMLPRYLATREEYSKGFLTYFATMAATVLLLSLIGPKDLAALGVPLPKEISSVAIPLAAALLLTGVMPNVPVLLEIEKWVRKYAHERAYIPAAARATAQRMAAAEFDFTAYVDALREPEMRGVEAADFTKSRRSLEHDWARLSCLVYEQRSRRTAGMLDSLDADLLGAYRQDLENIEDKRRAMTADVAAYRTAQTTDPSYTNEALRRTIRDNLDKLYVLLGCAVRLKMQPHGDMDLALREFGFKLNRTTSLPGNDDLKLVGVSVVGVSVLVIGIVATIIGHLGLWTVSPVFPQMFFQPFIDTASTLVPHGAAIMTADLMRRRAIRDGTWFKGPQHSRPTICAKHVRVAIVCGIAGYVSLVLWGFAFQQSLTAKGFLIDAPNALLAMATGGFYVSHLDDVEMERRPSRLYELGPQALITGLFGLIAALVSFELTLGSAGIATDRICLNAIIGAAVGLALAWYIPEAASAAKYDPLAEAGKERARMLETAARERFGNADTAAGWLDRRHPALGGKSPRASAAEVDGFEHAISLLRTPQIVAA